MDEGRRRRWIRFWDRISRRYLEDVFESREFYAGIVDFLEREGYFVRDDTVLDVGSGPGTFAFHFATMARKVTAIDTSKGMLDSLRKGAMEQGIETIETARVDWKDFQGGEYDLVFSSLSPAIDGPEALLRMESFSRRSCAYITFGHPDERGCELREGIWEELFGERRERGSYDIRFPFSVLYDGGRSPNLRFFRHTLTWSVPVDQLVEEFVDYFSIFTEVDDEKRRRIREIAESASPGGTYEREYDQSLLLMYWKPDR